MKNKIKLSILMPVLNEGINLKIMLKILKATIDMPHEVLVVYDMPNDDSIPVVKAMQKDYPMLRLVHNKLGKGVINAIKAGVDAAIGEYVLLIAADDIGPVLAVDDMISLMDEGCDLVNATRYAYGGRNMGGIFISRILSKISNKLFYVLSGSALTDPTLGVKMFRRSLFNQLKLESKPVGWAVSFEFAIKAQLAGWKLGEVPMISINRFYGGKSSFKFGPWVVEYTKWFLWGFKHLHSSGRLRQKLQVKIPGKINLKRKK
jgi:glycosyltransferase involved in cell wall biosynthesis|tara:strand:- start:106 stop:888 length:783 start_codon:yes stop_codon:yes gene_type:complete